MNRAILFGAVLALLVCLPSACGRQQGNKGVEKLTGSTSNEPEESGKRTTGHNGAVKDPEPEERVEPAEPPVAASSRHLEAPGANKGTAQVDSADMRAALSKLATSLLIADLHGKQPERLIAQAVADNRKVDEHLASDNPERAIQSIRSRQYLSGRDDAVAKIANYFADRGKSILALHLTVRIGSVPLRSGILNRLARSRTRLEKISDRDLSQLLVSLEDPLHELARPSSTQSNSETRDVAWWDVSTGMAVGSGGKLLRTVDGGSIWSQLPSSPVDDLLQVEYLSSRDLVLTTSSGLFVSNDGGVAWKKAPVAANPTLFWLSSEHVLGFEKKRLVLSQDSGATWSDVHEFKRKLVAAGGMMSGPWVVALLKSKPRECDDAEIELQMSRDRGATWQRVRGVSIADYEGEVTMTRCSGAPGQLCIFWEPGQCCSSCMCGCEKQMVRIDADGRVWHIDGLSSKRIAVGGGETACYQSYRNFDCTISGSQSTLDFERRTMPADTAEEEILDLFMLGQTDIHMAVREGSAVTLFSSMDGGRSWQNRGAIEPQLLKDLEPQKGRLLLPGDSVPPLPCPPYRLKDSQLHVAVEFLLTSHCPNAEVELEDGRYTARTDKGQVCRVLAIQEGSFTVPGSCQVVVALELGGTRGGYYLVHLSPGFPKVHPTTELIEWMAGDVNLLGTYRTHDTDRLIACIKSAGDVAWGGGCYDVALSGKHAPVQWSAVELTSIGFGDNEEPGEQEATTYWERAATGMELLDSDGDGIPAEVVLHMEDRTGIFESGRRKQTSAESSSVRLVPSSGRLVPVP